MPDRRPLQKPRIGPLSQVGADLEPDAALGGEVEGRRQASAVGLRAAGGAGVERAPRRLAARPREPARRRASSSPRLFQLVQAAQRLGGVRVDTLAPSRDRQAQRQKRRPRVVQVGTMPARATSPRSVPVGWNRDGAGRDASTIAVDALSKEKSVSWEFAAVGADSTGGEREGGSGVRGARGERNWFFAKKVRTQNWTW